MKTEKEKMCCGDYYFANDKELAMDRHKAKKTTAPTQCN